MMFGVTLITTSCMATAYFMISIYMANRKDRTKQKTTDNVFKLAVVLAVLVAAAIVSLFYVSPLVQLYVIHFVLFINLVLFIITAIKIVLLKEKVVSGTDISIDPIMSRKPEMSKWGYLAISVVISFVLFASDYSEIMPDSLSIFQGHFQTFSGQVQDIDRRGDEIDFFIGDEPHYSSFRIVNNDFMELKEGSSYSVKYLPNSKYVVDILDENKKSLLK